MKKKLYIVGAGSVGGHIAWNIDSYGSEYEIAGFLDDDPDKIGMEMFGNRVLGPVDELLSIEHAAVIFGIAFPKVKRQIVERLTVNATLTFPALIHERAWLSNGASIGEGSVIYPGTSINYGSVIGNFVVLNMNCALGHHTRIGNYSSFAPGVSTGGHTTVGEGVDIGIGASTIQDVMIGSGSVVGGNSMLIRDVQPNSKVAGVPARQF